MVKVALGEDSHRFEPVSSIKPLMIGGVLIEGCPGLAGNSDADVVLHALTNALSGISGVPILGPVSDRMCLEEGITDSKEYVQKAVESIGEYGISHVSVSVEAKRPKLLPYYDTIRMQIAALLSIPVTAVGFTATSGEALSECGKGNGIHAFVIVTCCARRNE
jgi:2-C-methyl-D-erythritol 2,4-cyclodiphosphate synthase